jgi:hypothetical protein
MNLSVKKWLNQFKKYFFTYKDGFFELPYLANSPELMIESFSSMPFMKQDCNKACFSADTPFLKGVGHYQKTEDGLWIILSDFEVKKNISFDPTCSS